MEQCQSILNCHSNITLIEGSLHGEKKWVCEFCGFENIIQIESEDTPKEDDVLYCIAKKEKVKTLGEEDLSIIFCIDNSGSMSITSEVSKDFEFKRETVSNSELEQLKAFLEPWEYK